ncbi:chromosomal replication initiator protein [Breznakia sp. PF5-3]|uniref:chromosomal replication initiator protein DnaA n=1 Tax=unclassified Breznakia TaxID=2623764 RepID=UPI002406C7C1|nr:MULTISPECIES: chromosomal replication initiator protein DnaA [unclassified Breznakia]MDL2276025.1 chromosomal replication initiator protein DnaA [Breznakia sp. OttesenSCG-928-G09]MDF9824332.1 chromosomal replication initiator protein [Breznakia sp. PM6-1]MDF9835077.1 chromosomal replication initiator protein [Breznakia sp. PF5-3]MDF9837752.1 chromosomal replication initiator protein [Breznakia sp. PFB2-8]MDF9859631.1 chromosomal replication initiator protein [Breznakia sp. PH5-24]
MNQFVQNDLQTVWGQILTKIKEDNIFDEPVFHSYIKSSLLYNISDEMAIIEVPYVTNKNFFIQNIDEFQKLLSQAFNRELHCQVVLSSEISNVNREEKKDFIFEYGNKILDQYTFDNFIQGQSNQQSFAAAYGCAYSKEKSFFNPLFIYGNSGLGKTHLLHAICNYLKENRPDIKYLYIDGNDFISLIINSLKEKNTDQLIEEIIKLDYLLIDDIQHLAKTNQSQELFFNIYNKLKSNGKQIVLTSDVYPSELKNINDRIISRFTSGLSVSITSPEFETAVSILQKKLEGRNKEINISEDALYYIAHKFNEDVRKLEGALNELLFKAIIYNPPIIDEKFTIEMFKENPIINQNDELTIKKIKKEVCNFYNITLKQIESKSRTADIANARHIAIYLSRELLDTPFKKIGSEFGNRDHSTIMTSYDKISKLSKEKSIYKDVIDEIKEKLGIN